MEFPQSKFHKNADSVASVQRDERRTEGAALYFTVTAFLFDPVISTCTIKATVFPANTVAFLSPFLPPAK